MVEETDARGNIRNSTAVDVQSQLNLSFRGIASDRG